MCSTLPRSRCAFWWLVLVVAVMAVGCTPERPSIGDEAAPQACSADGVPPDLDFDGLPSAVTRVRTSIVDAALACDYRRLDGIAQRGDLVATFDGDVVRPREWGELEHDGLPVMSALVELFTLPSTRTGGTVVWPSAAEWSSLDEGSPEDQRLIEAVDAGSGLYTWSPDGDYLGWRATLTNDGRWSGFSLGAQPTETP